MANIRVTCPACKSELEIDEAFDGQEVECGNCLEVFVAKGPKSSGTGTPGAGKIPGKIPGAGTSRAGTSGAGSSRGKPQDRPAKKKRRDDDDDDYDHDRRRRDDDDYDDEDYAPPPPRRSGGGESNGLGITSVILGVLSIPICCCGVFSLPFSLGAIATGAIGLARPGDKALPVIGLVLGVVGLSLVALSWAAGFRPVFNNLQ